MPRGIEHRTVTPIIENFRAILRGRNHKNSLRYADTIASHNQPPPDIPGGPYHRLTKAYYYNRDARREVTPPVVVVSASTKLITERKETGKPKALTPGKTYNCD